MGIRDSITPEEGGSQAAPDTGAAEAVSFQDVGMAYPGSGEESLSHVTFTAQRGQTIGVIGGTGSGKSTLVSLTPRLYDCTSGVEMCIRDSSRGAWIESSALPSRHTTPPPSLPSRGAWIEIITHQYTRLSHIVAPLTGSVD